MNLNRYIWQQIINNNSSDIVRIVSREPTRYVTCSKCLAAE